MLTVLVGLLLYNFYNSLAMTKILKIPAQIAFAIFITTNIVFYNAENFVYVFVTYISPLFFLSLGALVFISRGYKRFFNSDQRESDEFYKEVSKFIVILIFFMLFVFPYIYIYIKMFGEFKSIVLFYEYFKEINPFYILVVVDFIYGFIPYSDEFGVVGIFIRLYFCGMIFNSIVSIILLSFGLVLTTYGKYIERYFDILRITESMSEALVIKLFYLLIPYILIGILFSGIYEIVIFYDENSFNNLKEGDLASSIYFSFVTMTTLGYGDVYPLTGLAKFVTVLESTIGVLYLAIVVGISIGAGLSMTKISDARKIENDVVSDSGYIMDRPESKKSFRRNSIKLR